MARKTIAIILLSLLLVLSIATPSYCDDAVRKLGRGAANVATFPVEIVEQINRVNNSDGPLAAATYGVAKGIVMSGVRAVVGVTELLTFPVPWPKSNFSPILTDPEFFFEDKSW